MISSLDLIDGMGSGVSPGADGKNFWALFPPSKHTICVCIYACKNVKFVAGA